MTTARSSSRRPSRRDGFEYLSSTLATELLERLDAQCEKRVVGRNRIVERALDEYLTKLEAQEVLP